MYKYVKDFKTINLAPKTRCVTLGFFDGVHLGHQKLLAEGITYNCTNTIITFDVHFTKTALINLEQKIELLQKFPYDEIIVIEASKKNLNISYE